MTEHFNPYGPPDEFRPLAIRKRRGGWLLIYPVAMVTGALILSACLESAMRGEDLDGPGAGAMILFLFAGASVIGAAVALILVVIVHAVLNSMRDRDTGNFEGFGRDLGDGF